MPLVRDPLTDSVGPPYTDGTAWNDAWYQQFADRIDAALAGVEPVYGTWTPTLTGVTTAGVQTYGTQTGFSTKIGRQVMLHWHVALTAKGGTMAGTIQIAGFPTAISSDNAFAGVTIGYFGNLATNWVWLSGHVVPGTSTFQLGGRKTAGATFEYLAAADIGNTTDIRGVTLYRSAA